MLIVQKFGGSSVADLEKLRRAAGICADARRKKHDIVVVVSAMGDSTDDLLDIAHQISPQPPPRELDALLCCGEQQSAALMAIMLESMGFAARSFSGWQAGLFTEGRHGDANISSIAPRRVEAALKNGAIAVVSGFQGLDREGDLSTLGRGGSDTSAAALAAALGAERCEIYTDVDGIYTADPRLVENARLLREIDFRDMLLLARCGSQVLHEKSVALAMNSGVELYLLSSFRQGEGSVVRFLPEERRPALSGITRNPATGEISVVGTAADDALRLKLTELLSGQGIEVHSAGAVAGRVFVRCGKERLEAALRLIHDNCF